MPRTIYEKSDVVALLAELFRDLGYDGTSFGEITERTGVSKGSLYHFFPNGKEEMAAEVLAEIDRWFIESVFEPLDHVDPVTAIARMWESVDSYFRSGRRVCLVGSFALDATRDRFAVAISGYFERWIRSLAKCLARAGVAAREANSRAEEVVLGIQGALVLSRALHDEQVFTRALDRLRETINTVLQQKGSAGRDKGAPKQSSQRTSARK